MSNDDDPLDFNAGLVKKLRGEITDSKQILDDIVKGSRIYWQRVQAVHQAALILMEAVDAKQAVQLLQEDVARMLGMDAAYIFLQRGQANVVGHAALLFKPIPLPFMPMLDQKAFVLREAEVASQLFPSTEGPITSAAGIPINIEGLAGLLALGSREESNFGSGQALEPYIFLGQVIERMGRVWFAEKPLS